MRKFFIATVVALSFAVSGAAQAMEPLMTGKNATAAVEGLSQMTKDEVVEMLSGNTIPWSGGNGAYYAPDGTLEIMWKGSRMSGEWRVNNDGMDCMRIPRWWKSDEKCMGRWYATEAGVIGYIKSKKKAHLKLYSEIVEGNQIDQF